MNLWRKLYICWLHVPNTENFWDSKSKMVSWCILIELNTVAWNQTRILKPKQDIEFKKNFAKVHIGRVIPMRFEKFDMVLSDSFSCLNTDIFSSFYCVSFKWIYHKELTVYIFTKIIQVK